MSQTIKPTIGRVVLYHPSAGITSAAIIAHVHSDTMVNLAVFNEGGESRGVTSVSLIAADAPKPEFSPYCEWMPFQVGQAKKHEESATLTLSPEILAALKRIILRVDQQIALEMAGQL